jgi:hypothetical protein
LLPNAAVFATHTLSLSAVQFQDLVDPLTIHISGSDRRSRHPSGVNCDVRQAVRSGMPWITSTVGGTSDLEEAADTSRPSSPWTG